MGQNRKKINGKELVLDISYDIVGSVLYALGIYTFAKTADFAPGGLSGLALIMNHLWRFPIGITTLALNIPLIILSFKLVGRRFMFKSARTMIVCTIFLDLIFPNTGHPSRIIKRSIAMVTNPIDKCGLIALIDIVRRGEEENIFPYQEEADVMFNSSLLYELAVLKQYVEPLVLASRTSRRISLPSVEGIRLCSSIFNCVRALM